MQKHDLNKGFMQQFRQQRIEYPCVVEQQYEDFLFRQFAGMENEIRFLGKWFTKTIEDHSTALRIIAHLEKEIIPLSRRLSYFLKGMTMTLTAYVSKEPYTASYYHTLLGALRHFSQLMEIHTTKSYPGMLQAFRSSFPGNLKQENVDWRSEDLSDVETLIEILLSEVHEYYDHFNLFMQLESANDNHRVRAGTEIEQYLLKLLYLMEQVLLRIDTLKVDLAHWERQLTTLELQELYN